MSVVAPGDLIVDRLRSLAAERPTATAIVDVSADVEHALTWAELSAQVDRMAELLLRLGVQPGEPVGIQLPNWNEFIVITLATAKVGAVVCPLMPFLREREVGFVLERARVRVLFIAERFRGRDYVPMLETLAASEPAQAAGLRHVVVARRDGASPLPPADAHGFRFHDYEEALANPASVGPAPEPRPAPTPDDLAQLLYTSGTSGEPKGALHRHRTLDLAVAMHIAHFELTDADVIYAPSPLAHQTGFLYGMWMALRLGSTFVHQDVWDAAVCLRAIRRHRISFIQAATPCLADPVAAIEGREPAPAHLHWFVATGAAVPRSLARNATEHLGTVVGGWGTTESCMGTAGGPGDPPEKVWGTDGRPLDGIRIRIVDEDGNVLPAGAEGEYQVLTPLMFAGYLDHDDWTAAAYTEDGWFRTGDLATIDADGFIRIVGRAKDVINRGGEKIPVVEIEGLLYEHPAVAEVAIVAMPDERLGERACAFVVLRSGRSSGASTASDAGVSTASGGLDFASMQQFLDSRQVARQYWPERLELIDALPRTPSGKIQKYVLRERAKGLASERVKESQG